MLALYLVLYILLTTCFTQFYKLTTKTMKNAAAQTVGLQFVAGLSCLLFLPFFSFRFPENPWVYFFLCLSCVFYAMNNWMMANVRKNLEASVIGIIQQSYTVLMTLAGFFLYNEGANVLKVLGILLIIAGNVLVFYHSSRKSLKYVYLGLLAYTCNVVAGLIDIGYSGEFNLGFYTAFLYFIPALFILIGSRAKLKSIVDEFKRANKRNYFITGFCWGIHYLVLLLAYQFGDVSVVAPLASLTVFSNVLVGYIWLRERDRPIRKFIAALMAILGVVLISL